MDTLPHWLLYAAGLWLFNLVLLPGLFWGAAWIGRKLAGETKIRDLFVAFAYTLVPLGLAAWIAFSLGFVFVNGSYALSVLSDPFGWGWNLFGTADAAWTPFAPQLLSFLQVGVLSVGLMFAVNTAYRSARQFYADHRGAFTAMLPVAGLLTLITGVFMVLYLG